MSAYTRGSAVPMPPMVSCFGQPTGRYPSIPSAPASAAWESANRAVYYPILVTATCIVRRVWWANGASVSASYTIDCGLYADNGYCPGVRLVSSGDTAQGTASQVQFVDVTDTAITPGRYWLALACDSTSATFFRSWLGSSTSSVAGAINGAFRFQQATARPLPSTATPVESSDAYAYLFGFATTASP